VWRLREEVIPTRKRKEMVTLVPDIDPVRTAAGKPDVVEQVKTIEVFQ